MGDTDGDTPGDQSTLTFTATNWATGQTVTLTAQGDDDGGNESVAVTHAAATASASEYTNVSAELTANVADDDTPALTLSATTLSVPEQGSAAYTVRLATLPVGGSVTVAVSGAGDGITVDTDGATGGDQDTLTFTTTNWATAQTVTVAAVDDTTDAPDKQVTVSGTASDSLGLAQDPSSVTLTMTDDDAAPGVTLSLSDASIGESGGTSTVSAVLSHPSSAATTVTVTAVSGAFTVPSGAAGAIVIPAGGTTAATDTVTAVDNDVDAPDNPVTVTATVANDQGAGSVTDATLTLEDDEGAPTVTLSVSPASVSENGATATVRATLSHPSSEPTTVTVTEQTGVFTVAAGAGATIIVAAGQTTTTDTATITAVDNDVDAADNPVTVAAAAGNGHGVGAVTGASLTLADDDVAGIVTSPATSAASRVRTSEDGSTATVDVVLATEPTGDVRMDVASSDTAQGTVSPAMLTFTSTNWNTAQTVTLTGVDDSPDAVDGSQTYTVSLTVDTANTADANYDALSAVTIYAINADDELGLDVGAVSGPATEADGTATFTVRLVTDPALATQASQSVTVSVTSRDAGEGRVSPPSLTFTATSWSTAQTVVVTGVDDEVDDGDEPYRIGTGDPSSPDDATYDALGAGDGDDVDVVNRDDDATPAVALVLAPSTIDEGGTASTVSTVTAVLSHPSDEATTVTMAATAVAGSGAVAGDFTLSTETTLTIAALATASTGTVTVAAVDNAVDAPDKEVTVSGTAANDRASADSAVMAVTAATLTIADDDERGLAFAGAGADPEDFEGVLDVAEGGEVAYTVALASAPVGTVSVAVAAGNPSLSVAPERLTFTAEDWNTPRTVTVAAQDDGDDYVNEASWVSHTASGGGYDEVSGVLPVSVQGETTVRVKAAAGTTTWVIEGRRVVVTVAAGVPEGIEVDFAGVGSGPAEAEPAMTVEGPAAVAAEVVARAAGDGFNLGPEEVRTVVDVAVTDLAGVGLCLPVAAAVVAGLPEGHRAAAAAALRRGRLGGRGGGVPPGGGDGAGTGLRRGGGFVLALRVGVRGHQAGVRCGGVPGEARLECGRARRSRDAAAGHGRGLRRRGLPRGRGPGLPPGAADAAARSRLRRRRVGRVRQGAHAVRHADGGVRGEALHLDGGGRGRPSGHPRIHHRGEVDPGQGAGAAEANQRVHPAGGVAGVVGQRDGGGGGPAGVCGGRRRFGGVGRGAGRGAGGVRAGERAGAGRRCVVEGDVERAVVRGGPRGRRR